MKELTYRTATEKDLKQLQLLGLLAYGQYKPTITKENWEKWETAFKDESNFIGLLKISICFVCEDEDEIVGMAFFIPSGNPFVHFPIEWSYIRYVGVNPTYSGKGIGKKLTQQCIEAARNAGEKTIGLHTSEFQNAARHIYESLGFIKQKELQPIFGKVFYIKDNFNTNNSFSSLGSFLNEYELPNGIQLFTKQAFEYLAGSQSFKVSEIEIL